MSFKKIVFSEPVEKLSGKKNKGANVCFFQGTVYGQRAWGTGKRNLKEHPYTQSEKDTKTEFTQIAKAVSKRVDSMSSTFAADVKAFMAQRDQPGGIKRFRAWLWKQEKDKLNA